MKVLHLSGSKSHWSGNEQQLVDLIQNLNVFGVENAIFCYENSEIGKYSEKNNISCFPQKRHGIYSPQLARLLKKVVKEQKIDVIHVHTSNFLTVFMLSDLLFRLNVPTVFSRKGFSEKSSFLSALKYNYAGITRTICVSDAVRKGLMNFVKPKNHHKLVVIYDGISTKKGNAPTSVVELREKYAIEKTKIIIGNIANHVPAKDLVTFVKTADFLINNFHNKNVHFVVIGKKTDFTDELENLVEELDLRSSITFTGEIPKAKELISQLDIFFMSSKSEGLSLTIYESFLYEKPVVSTVAGGIPEAIEDGVNGFLSEIGDFESLAEKLNELINNPNLQKQFVEKSLVLLCEKFDAKICAQQTLSLYKEIQS